MSYPLYTMPSALELSKCTYDSAPGAVDVVTAAIDLQKDRFEVMIEAGVGGVRYVLDYQKIACNYDDAGGWRVLDYIMRRDWCGRKIDMAIIDAGYRAYEVYRFCKEYNFTRIRPVKGFVGAPAVRSPTFYNYESEYGRVSGITLSMVNSSILKGLVYRAIDEGLYRFPKYGMEFFHGVCSEIRQMRIVNGGEQAYWMRMVQRNEPLDLLAYNVAANKVLKGEYDEQEDQC